MRMTDTIRMNLAVKAVDFEGAPLKERGEELWLNKVLANVIMTQHAQDDTTMQKFELAHKLYNAKGEADFTESEKEIIAGACRSGRMMIIIAAQVLKIINNVKK